MNNDLLLKIQSFVDGELDEAGQTEVAALMARDPDVHALVKELKQTRQALVAHEGSLDLPESREFYWSKIERQITGSMPVDEGPMPTGSLLSTLTRWLAPAACLAGILVMAFLFTGRDNAAADTLRWQAGFDGVNALTYRDYDEGITVLWLTYPSDNGVANSEEAATIN